MSYIVQHELNIAHLRPPSRKSTSAGRYNPQLRLSIQQLVSSGCPAYCRPPQRTVGVSMMPMIAISAFMRFCKKNCSFPLLFVVVVVDVLDITMAISLAGSP
jgi:hypothetical protein